MAMIIRLIVILFLLIIHWCRKSEQDQKINCSGEYRESSGFIESSGYPHGYSNNLYCKWRIQSSRGTVIMIKVEDFELQKKYNSKQCEDYLMINDTIASKAVLHKICGERNTPFLLRSYCHGIEVIFLSDRGGDAKGFRLTWMAVKTKQKNRNCGENVTTFSGDGRIELLNKYLTSSSKKFKAYTTSYAVVSFTKYGPLMVDGSALPSSSKSKKFNCKGEYRGSSGFIESPGYPNGYSNNLDCKWRIQSSRGTVIIIKIEDFELQKKYNSRLCEDYLMIIDTITSKVLLHKTCWELNIPYSRNSYCHDIEVIFHSDRGGNAKGFRLLWNTERTKQNNRNCGENFTTIFGEATTKLLNKYITSSSKKFKANTISYAIVPSTKYTTTPKSTESSTRSEEDTTLFTSTKFSEGAKLRTTENPRPASTVIYMALSGMLFTNIIAVVVNCFVLKDRLKRLVLKNDKEKDDSTELWKRPRSFGSDVRRSVDQSKVENIYSEPKDVILSIQRQPKKPLVNRDLLRICNETSISATASEKERARNDTNNKDGKAAPIII